MRIIKIALILLGFLAVMLPKATMASETSDIDTKTNTNLNNSSIPSFLLPNQALAAEIVGQGASTAASQIQMKPAGDTRYQELLAKWKEKQSDKWAKLPSGPFKINASAYTASADECGNDKGITASGLKVQAKRTIACPPAFPFGAKLNIEGYGTFVCEDRGGAIKGNHIDIYMETKGEAFAFGRKNLNAEIVY